MLHQHNGEKEGGTHGIKQKIFLILHVVLTAGAAALTAISSAMAYPLGNMGAIIFMSGAAILLDLLLMLRKKDGILRDAALLLNVVLTTLCFCRVLTGRADLMGYVWFSDLEKGNSTAVNSLTLAAIALGGFLLGSVMNIVQGFWRTRG